MKIREMLEADLLSVCIIEQEIFSEPWSKEDFYNSIKDNNHLYLIAEIEGNVVGYCGYWGIAGEGNIYNIAVNKEYRRQQIGYLLLKELINKGIEKGVNTFTLEVRRSNEAAILLYQRLGFQSVGIRKSFYSKPKEDAVIMWLEMIQ